MLDKENQVVCSFLDSQTDLSVWIKGTPVTYEFTPNVRSIKKGEYTWAVALVDTTKGNGSNIKGLNIAAKGDITAEGWLKLRNVSVK